MSLKIEPATTCSSRAPGSASYGYSITGASTFDITVPAAGYTSVVTYTKQ